MPEHPSAARPVNEAASAARLSPRPTGKLALLAVSIAFGLVAFLALDWLRSAAIRRSWTGMSHFSCGISDPIRYTAFKSNCVSTMAWGPYPFEFATNSLGLRDEKVREVPLADSRPRILMLGNSFTQSEGTWQESYVGRIAAHFPQYDFLNGGVMGYSPSNYLNTARILLAKGVEIDEVIVFVGVSDVFDEAASYQDVGDSGAVTPVRKPSEPRHGLHYWYEKHYVYLANQFMLTHALVEMIERFLVAHGHYSVTASRPDLPVFDADPHAWTYRAINPIAWAPLGVDGGIAKAEARMTALWQELGRRNIPISVVVYPYVPQLIHDTVDSRQVRLWRDWCAGKCKRFISVFPEFFAVKDQCPRFQPGCWYLKLFIFGDMHYSAAGNALVADAVIQSLAQDPPAKRPEEDLSPDSRAGAH